jgi:drug/metabolite transporter (DMT)-like permease
MVFLILCILSSSLIFVVFKILDIHKIEILPVIIINYLTASITGLILGVNNNELILSINDGWFPLSIIIGILFILMFFIVGKSTQNAGISVTTVASKMSVIIPVLFSMLADPGDNLNNMKIIGIATALVAVFLTLYPKKSIAIHTSAVLYPALLFLGMGLVDSLVKYSQLTYIEDHLLPVFTTILFFIAFLTGIIFFIFCKRKVSLLLKPKTLVAGVFLGLSNFGSIFFIIKALNYKNQVGKGIDSSSVFAINNTGIVVLSVFSGILLFRERLRPVNIVGILLSIAAIIIFAYA